MSTHARSKLAKTKPTEPRNRIKKNREEKVHGGIDREKEKINTGKREAEDEGVRGGGGYVIYIVTGGNAS